MSLYDRDYMRGDSERRPCNDDRPGLWARLRFAWWQVCRWFRGRR